MLLDSVLLFYILLVCVSVFLARKSQEDYLSPKVTNSLRGVAAIGIILHHMAERTTSGTVFPVLGMIGYLMVALFFFLSGYGLLIQYQKRENYLDGFLKKRVLYLVLVYLLDVAVYAVYDLLMGKPHPLFAIVKSVFFGGIASNSWYMIVLILFYFAFYGIFRFLPKASVGQKIGCVLGFQLLFAAVCVLTSRSSVWYLSNLGFALGMFWAWKKGSIDRRLSQSYFRFGGLVVLAFLLFYLTPPVVERLFSESAATEALRLFCRLISSPLSVAVLAVVLYKFKPVMPLWDKLGTISLEIYLLHGMVYRFLRSGVVYIENEALWTLLTIGIAILIAIPAHYLNRAIADRLKRG